MRVTAPPVDIDSNPMPMFGGSNIKDTGAFEVEGLIGQRVFRVGNLPKGWVLKQVTPERRGRDRQGRRVQARRRRRGPRDRADEPHHRHRRRRHRQPRPAAEGLHGRGVRRGPGEVDDAADALDRLVTPRPGRAASSSPTCRRARTTPSPWSTSRRGNGAIRNGSRARARRRRASCSTRARRRCSN